MEYQEHGRWNTKKAEAIYQLWDEVDGGDAGIIVDDNDTKDDGYDGSAAADDNDEDGVDVTDSLEVEVLPSILTITPSAITVRAKSLSHEYDGNPYL